MFDYLRNYRTPVVVALAILLPIMVFRANRGAHRYNTLDRLVLIATTPFNSLMSRLTGKVSDAWYGYVDLANARQESVKLRRAMIDLERERDQLKFLEQENERLRRLLKLSELNPELDTVGGTVIGAGSSLTTRTLTIDVGMTSGIERGDPVLAGQGLVGVVYRVAWTSSEVMLISDPRLMVKAHVVESRARGRLHGLGPPSGHTLRFGDYLSDKVKKGDRVATSGLGGVFPKGVPIGEVREVYQPEGASRSVSDVEPYVDFSRLEYVTVLIGQTVPKTFNTPPDMLPPSLVTSTVTATVARSGP